MTATMNMTNEKFGELVGCDYTMASRLRSGDRLPSRALLERIVKTFELDGTEALRATARGGRAFADFLDQKVFRTSSE
jgi:hypothetical protein